MALATALWRANPLTMSLNESSGEVAPLWGVAKSVTGALDDYEPVIRWTVQAQPTRGEARWGGR